MQETIRAALDTLSAHLGAAGWAMAVFFVGFAFAFPVVHYAAPSLLAFPLWLIRTARKYLRPSVNPVLLCLFIFGFNTIAIFAYMASGGLIWLPMVFDFLTGLNVGVIVLKDAQEPLAETEPDDGPPAPPPRAWIGFLGLFVVIVELTSFWLAIGMGIKLGHLMQDDFTWQAYVTGMHDRVLAYAVILVPALAASAAAETAAIKGMMHLAPEPPGTGDETPDDPAGP